MQENDLNEMVLGYIAAALWTTTTDDTVLEGEHLSDEYGPEAVTEVAKIRVRELCQEFVLQNLQDVQAYAKTLTWSQVGHDLWLTSSGHGTGFWDRGLHVLCERLSRAAQNSNPLGFFLDPETDTIFVE